MNVDANVAPVPPSWDMLRRMFHGSEPIGGSAGGSVDVHQHPTKERHQSGISAKEQGSGVVDISTWAGMRHLNLALTSSLEAKLNVAFGH